MRRLSSWDMEYTSEETNRILTGIASKHLLGKGENSDPQEREVARLLQARDYRGLCDFELNYDNISVDAALRVRQVLAFFGKRVDLDLGVDREAVAYEKFRASERMCRDTNDIFRAWSRGRFRFRPRVERVLFLAQRKIASVLGLCPAVSDISVRFGPGATTEVTKRNACPLIKLRSGFQCSEGLATWAQAGLLSEFPGWFGLNSESPDSVLVDVKIVDGKLSFVRKTALTDRGIVVEPSGNSMFQLGVGDTISSLLRAVGVDLRDQSLNQRLARRGSLTGDVATLDLVGASDCVATELVAHLLPVDWFLLLDLLRSKNIAYRGDRIRLEKFSSMGNGFTFPLESLIFWAIASSCGDGKDYVCSVYGDDIIVSTYAYDLVVEVLQAVGFTPNLKKSFASGPFRESCGADYMCGIDIRPIYIKDRLSGEDVFRAHNFFVRELRNDIADDLLQLVSPHLQKWGPDGYGDGHLVGPWTPLPLHRDRGYGGYTFETFTWSKRSLKAKLQPGDMALPLYSIYQREEEGDDDEFVATEDKKNLYLWRRDPVAALPFISTPTITYGRRSQPGKVNLPGRRGYKLIQIYTFDR